LTNPTGQRAPGDAAVDCLAAQARADLDCLRFPTEEWLAPRVHASGAHVYDVAIIGGGQGGLAIAAALRRDAVTNIKIFDRRPEGKEGPWGNIARMLTLRTQKHLPGIELGLPNLTPKAWFTARYGEQAWEKLDKIPKGDWQEYLLWYRRVVGIEVSNGTEVTNVTWDGDVFRLALSRLDEDGTASAADDVFARYVVLATGVDGNGAWYTPDFISSALPRSRYANSGDHIDFAALKGKRIAVLGAGASAFDNASTALEAGAAEATVCLRRAEIQRINPQFWMGKAGFLRHFSSMDDQWKWRFMRHMYSYNIPAPQDAYNRLSRLRGARVIQNAGWRGVKMVPTPTGEEIEVATSGGSALRVDFLIAAVGFKIDLRLRPELATLADDIALWKDKYTPAIGDEDPTLSSYPYLGSNFELTEKVAGAAPFLSRIRNFTYGATVSMGLSGSALSGLKYAVNDLANGISRSLFLEEVPRLYESFTSYSIPEMTGPVPFDNRPGMSAR